MLIVDPAVVLIQLVEFGDALVEDFRVEEVLQYDMGVGTGGLVFPAQLGQLGRPLAIIEYWGGSGHYR
jgi:hypothetical protein